MAKYIHKQAAIHALVNEANIHNSPIKRAYTRAVAIIEQITAEDVQPVNQWISIDERLPQDGEEALVYAGNRGVMIGLYDSVLQVWLDYECCGLKVTHWQPLPEPPKDGDTE